MSRRVAFGLLLFLAALLPVRAEASRTSGWESKPHASLSVARTEAASAVASLAPAAAADTEAAEPPLFDLGDVVLADAADPNEEHFGLGPLTLVDLNLLRGPPPSYPETRVGGFELLPPFRVGASPRLSLWSRQACGSISCGLVSDSPEDPWGLYSWGDFRKDVTDTARSYYGFLGQAALEGNGIYQLYNTVNTATALAGRTKELYRKGGASAVADAAITDVASSLPIVNTVLNASRIVDTYENQGAFEGGRQVFRTTKAAATDVAAVYGIGKTATLPEPSTSIMPPEGWRFEGAAPARRPTWQESEQFFGDELRDFGFRSQVAFKNGEEVAPSVTGSVRPDHSSALVRLAVEIKNYNISTAKGRRDLVRRIGKQVALRSVELPPGTRQGIIIDARGQTIAPGVLEDLEGRISARTRGVISPDNIYVQQ